MSKDLMLVVDVENQERSDFDFIKKFVTRDFGEKISLDSVVVRSIQTQRSLEIDVKDGAVQFKESNLSLFIKKNPAVYIHGGFSIKYKEADADDMLYLDFSVHLYRKRVVGATDLSKKSFFDLSERAEVLLDVLNGIFAFYNGLGTALVYNDNGVTLICLRGLHQGYFEVPLPDWEKGVTIHEEELFEVGYRDKRVEYLSDETLIVLASTDFPNGYFSPELFRMQQ